MTGAFWGGPRGALHGHRQFEGVSDGNEVSMRKNKGGVRDRAKSFPQNRVLSPCQVVPHKDSSSRASPARSITRAYYRNSVGGLLLFDITNRRSFQNVHEWLEETKVRVQPYQIVFVLVGHKCDLDTQRQVTRHEAEKLAAAYGMKYIETSARDAINVEKAFTDLTRDIYELVKRGEISIQEGWEGVKSGFVPNVVHSSEEVVKSDRRCLC
ncbi:ras-related protein Rab-39B [Egretta garzetta]|nr:ras-related protein Rab-39B [Egretta garzetta]